MKPDDYWQTLETQEDKENYATESGSTYLYLSKHILRKKGMTRMPGKKLLVGLVRASKGKVSLDEAIDYFMVQPTIEFAEKQNNKKAA